MATWLILSALLATAPARGETPSMAVVLAAAGRGPHPAATVDVPRGTFSGLPKPAPGVTYLAKPIVGSRRDVFRVRVQAALRGRVVASGTFSFRWIVVRPTVVVATARIPKGSAIEARDVELQDYRGHRPDYFLASIDDVRGFVARYDLLPGAPIRTNAVRPPYLVFRGRAVRVRARVGGLEVSTTATALSDGGLGQLVRVTNEKTKATVEAQVVGPDEAEVNVR